MELANLARIPAQDGSDAFAAWDNKAVCTKAHDFDHESHLPGEALCTLNHSASERERIIRAGGHTCHNQGRAPKAQVSSSYVLSGMTYYLVKFADSGSKARYYFKHFSDFVALHKGLQELSDGRPWSESPISILPQLPETGRFGVRHRLSTIGVGSFAKKFQDELDGWLQMILAQVSSLCVSPALEEFFGPDPLPAGMPEAQRTKLEGLRTLLVHGGDPEKVAEAAASEAKAEGDKNNEDIIKEETVKEEVEDEEENKSETEKDDEQKLSLPSKGRRQLRTQKTVGALAFESLEEGSERRQLKTQNTVGALAFDGATTTGLSSRRRPLLRRQDTAGAMAFESVGL